MYYRRRFYFTIFTILIAFVCCLFLIKKNLPADKSSSLPSFSSGSSISFDHIYSSSGILIQLDNGNLTGGKKMTKRIYPASLTKIMTAVVALEHAESLDQQIILPPDIFPGLQVQDASMAGFQPNESTSAKDLLYGVLLPSGGECCLALANSIAGSEDNFVALMNKKADELGMTDTHFTNSTGLHNTDHYSTVKDLASLLKYALKNEDFRTIFTTKQYSVPSTNQHPDGFTFHSSLFETADTAVNGGEILGGKTGYTDHAGLCLASLANINGVDYILVTAGAKGSQNTEPFHIIDARRIFNQLSANSD